MSTVAPSIAGALVGGSLFNLFGVRMLPASTYTNPHCGNIFLRVNDKDIFEKFLNKNNAKHSC